MSDPRVSVIIPTYNRSWGLRRAVASAMEQTFSDFESLIVDDGSTDDTSEVSRSFADARLFYHRQPRNVGVARNWGTGVELARGEFVALLMDDDRYEPGFLARRVAALREHPTAALAFSGYRAVDESGAVVRHHSPSRKPGLLIGEDFVTAALARDCFIGASLYRTAALRSIWKASEAAGIVADFAANVLLSIQPEASAVFLDGADFWMSHHPGQLSQTRTDEAFRATVGVLDRLLAEPLVPPATRRLILREAASWHVVGGRQAAAAGKRCEAVRRLVKAAWLTPWSRGPWTQLARAVTGL
jgi:glycosyltransferase involved in cell wall biosynthesis